MLFTLPEFTKADAERVAGEVVKGKGFLRDRVAAAMLMAGDGLNTDHLNDALRIETAVFEPDAFTELVSGTKFNVDAASRISLAMTKKYESDSDKDQNIGSMAVVTHFGIRYDSSALSLPTLDVAKTGLRILLKAREGTDSRDLISRELAHNWLVPDFVEVGAEEIDGEAAPKSVGRHIVEPYRVGNWDRGLRLLDRPFVMPVDTQATVEFHMQVGQNDLSGVTGPTFKIRPMLYAYILVGVKGK